MNRSARPLVVIEAPGKRDRIATLFKRLSFTVDVWATQGHICSYPDSLFPLGFTPEGDEVGRQYDPVKLAQLRDVAAGRLVYVATDSDQEGDVIARDVEIAIRDIATEVARLRLAVLDSAGMRKALAEISLVRHSEAAAGDARRMFDRLVGHTFTTPGNPAGRVQSALLAHLREHEPIIGHVRLSLAASDGGAPYVATVPITPGTRALWEARAQELTTHAPVDAGEELLSSPAQPLTYAMALALLEGLPLEHLSQQGGSA